MGTTTRLMTLEDFERLPDEAASLELLKGELIRSPPPKRQHMEIAERLYLLLHETLLDLRNRRPELRLGKPHVEMGYLLGGDPKSWLRPDVSIAHPGQSGGDYYEGAPWVAVEVVSESEAAADVDSKAQEYLSHGSEEVWLIYPKTRRAWIYRAGASTIERHEQTLRSELLPGLEIRLDEIL